MLINLVNADNKDNAYNKDIAKNADNADNKDIAKNADNADKEHSI